MYFVSDNSDVDPPSFDLSTSLPIPSVLDAGVMPASMYSYKYSLGSLNLTLCRVLNKPSS
jgi:hypothetical protein